MRLLKTQFIVDVISSGETRELLLAQFNRYPKCVGLQPYRGTEAVTQLAVRGGGWRRRNGGVEQRCINLPLGRSYRRCVVDER